MPVIIEARVLPSLSHAQIIWTVIGSAATLLGFLHLSRGLMDSGSRFDLLFAVAAFAFVGVAYTELRSMYAPTPEAWAFWIRWCYVPLTAMIVALVLFVRDYLGTGRDWLAAILIGLRGLILALNAAHSPNVAFDRVDSIVRMPFLGDTISVVGRAETSSWQWLGTLATLLLAVYVVDAAATLWRRGGTEERRRAAVIGGAILLYAGIGGVYVQLVIWGFTRLPLLITPTFGLVILAMAYELSRDTLRAAGLARELRESERRLELAANAAELGLWEWNSRTNRVWATGQARRIFGFDDHEPHGIGDWLARIHPDDVQWIRPASAAAIEAGAEKHAEFRVCPPGGGTRWVAAHGRAEASDRGDGTLMRGVVRDISEQRRTLDESQELRRELTHVGRVSLLGQLASSLAHELSQPLGAILRNAEAAEMILGDAAPDIGELKAIVTDIRRDDHRAGEVIDRMRALLKRRRLDLQPVAVEGLLNDVVTLVRSDAASRQVAVTCSTEKPLPPVMGDRVHLSQVLLNLIINGMDAVMERPAADRRVAVTARRSADGAVEIAVSDSGAGIPPDSLPRVFDPFFTTKDGGMGIGLSVSKTIVDAHGGKIGVENGAAGGAVFRILLPPMQAPA